MMRMSRRPARTASSTTYWIAGLSTTGSISFGCAFVAGRKRVPRPAAGMTALLTATLMASPSSHPSSGLLDSVSAPRLRTVERAVGGCDQVAHRRAVIRAGRHAHRDRDRDHDLVHHERMLRDRLADLL